MAANIYSERSWIPSVTPIRSLQRAPQPRESRFQKFSGKHMASVVGVDATKHKLSGMNHMTWVCRKSPHLHRHTPSTCPAAPPPKLAVSPYNVCCNRVFSPLLKSFHVFPEGQHQQSKTGRRLHPLKIDIFNIAMQAFLANINLTHSSVSPDTKQEQYSPPSKYQDPERHWLMSAVSSLEHHSTDPGLHL